MNKSELRTILRARRRAFVSALDTAGGLDDALAAATQRLVDHLGGAQAIAAYWPSGAEFDTRPVLAALHARNCVVGLPHIDSPGGDMRFLRWSPESVLIAGAHGLLQPVADAVPIIPDLILTPLLGFDRRLMRLGQGAGYYDRLFARMPGVRRLGLAWSVQEVEEAPADAWDVPLHGLATEREWIESETP